MQLQVEAEPMTGFVSSLLTNPSESTPATLTTHLGELRFGVESATASDS